MLPTNTVSLQMNYVQKRAEKMKIISQIPVSSLKDARFNPDVQMFYFSQKKTARVLEI